MNKPKVKQILMKSLLKETVDLARLHQNINSRTEIGRAWIEMVNGLEKLLDEVNEFENLYIYSNKPPVDTAAAKTESRQILASAVRMMKTVEKMHAVQQKDLQG